jgi:hypothetical protein
MVSFCQEKSNNRKFHLDPNKHKKLRSNPLNLVSQINKTTSYNICEQGCPIQPLDGVVRSPTFVVFRCAPSASATFLDRRQLFSTLTDAHFTYSNAVFAKSSVSLK